MKFVLTVAGALALLAGLAFVGVGVVCVRATSGPGVDALYDALDTIAIGGFGALIGLGLVVYAGWASKPVV